MCSRGRGNIVSEFRVYFLVPCPLEIPFFSTLLIKLIFLELKKVRNQKLIFLELKKERLLGHMLKNLKWKFCLENCVNLPFME